LGWVRLSQEKALKTLESLGFTQLDAKVYVFLAKKGPQKAGDVAKCLKIPKQSIYFIIRNLQSDGIVTSTVERPARFSAVPFERVLDLFVNAKMEEAKQIQRNKEEILLDWQSIALTEIEGGTPKFAVLEGRNVIFSKIREMAQQTKKHLLAMITVPDLVRADQLGFFDAVITQSKESSIQFRLITELSEQNMESVMSVLKATPKQGLGLEIRAPDLGLRLSSRMIIRDNEEAIFFIDRGADFSVAEKNDVCLWTNCGSLVRSFAAVFEDSWLNSTEMQKKILEIKSGKQSQKTILIKDVETARKKYDEIISSAKRSIFIVTSNLGLVEFWKDKNKVVEWVQRGVAVKIMAPVTSENLKTAHQLLDICEVKHVPADYVGTTIVDGQHLFQFKTLSSGKETVLLPSYFENTFYSNDSDYVEKTENMLSDIWNNAQIPSPTTLRAVIQQPISLDKTAEADIFAEYRKEFKKIVGFSYRMEPQSGRITEKEILDKIANAVRSPAKDPEIDTIKFYGALGIAIIYPPKDLNLPPFMIHVNHYNKKSSFGAGSSLFIYIQTEIADQQSYLPAAFITNNHLGFKFRKAMQSRLHSTQIIQLLQKDEIKVHLQGDKLFAGWTVPIPLLPPKYILPPGCLTIEGYGKAKTYISEAKGPMNRRISYEYTSLDAFVTFMSPSLKYNGPGSDAVLHRDIITISRPPSAWKETDISAQ
jgi:sugar-specific transcriptional regulator TrmB